MATRMLDSSGWSAGQVGPGVLSLADTARGPSAHSVLHGPADCQQPSAQNAWRSIASADMRDCRMNWAIACMTAWWVSSMTP